MSLTWGEDVTWPVPPTWDQPVRETLAWLTDRMPSPTGSRQKRELRQVPTRSFAFDVLASDAERRLLENIRLDAGSRQWQLPIWHDAQRLTAPLAAAADEIACITDGFDFAVGAKVLLWASPTESEIVAIADLEDGLLTLEAGLASNWPVGTRLYPLRLARLGAPPEESFFSDSTSRQTVAFQVEEPCAWPAVLPATMYQGWPVLEQRPSEPKDWTAKYSRQLITVEDPTGFDFTTDLQQTAMRGQLTQWQLFGRDENASWRSLLYGLRGRMGELWLPSWSQDLKLVTAAAAIDAEIEVEYCGYTAFGNQQPGRRDIRIELVDGTTLLRRIIASMEVDGTELLTLDAALGVAIWPPGVRRISFMALVEASSDSIELQHVTDADGLTECSIQFEAAEEYLDEL